MTGCGEEFFGLFMKALMLDLQALVNFGNLVGVVMLFTDFRGVNRIGNKGFHLRWGSSKAVDMDTTAPLSS